MEWDDLKATLTVRNGAAKQLPELDRKDKSAN